MEGDDCKKGINEEGIENNSDRTYPRNTGEGSEGNTDVREGRLWLRGEGMKEIIPC
jgi:hypothetical protein